MKVADNVRHAAKEPDGWKKYLRRLKMEKAK